MNTLTPEQLRELDAWIAEHVMGWKQVESMLEMNVGEYCFGTKLPKVAWTRYEDTGHAVQFSPTTDPAASMMLLKKVLEFADLTIEGFDGTEVRIRQDINDPTFSVSESAPTLELALAQFARKLKEGLST